MSVELSVGVVRLSVGLPVGLLVGLPVGLVRPIALGYPPDPPDGDSGGYTLPGPAPVKVHPVHPAADLAGLVHRLNRLRAQMAPVRG